MYKEFTGSEKTQSNKTDMSSIFTPLRSNLSSFQLYGFCKLIFSCQSYFFENGFGGEIGLDGNQEGGVVPHISLFQDGEDAVHMSECPFMPLCALVDPPFP
jgi:hypothetical protein